MKALLTATSVLLCGAMLAIGAEEAKKEDAKPKCPVSGKVCENLDNSLSHNGGDVYFCCPNCPKAFEKDTAKFAVKANHQLVFTKQAKQGKCPFTGGKLNEEATIEVAGANVTFCCNNCKGKAEKAEGDEQLALIFNNEAFKKGFTVEKKKTN
jgi:YHS domain-containing protein